MATFILPAHNEGSVIQRSLASLLGQIDEQDEVIVVANGCNDDTAEVARSVSSRVQVIDTSVPSKTNALNLADAKARSFPRIYMDADIVLTEGSIGLLKQALSTGTLLAVAPTPHMDFSNANWFVKAYYDIWLSMPFSQAGMMGAGVYVLSEQGRKRFAQFPDVIADDGYVRALFKEHERSRVAGAYAIVRAPASLHFLMKIKTRSRMGQMQLAMRYPELLANEQKKHGQGLSHIIKQPLLWPKAAVYLYVAVMSRYLAKKKLNNLAQYRWEKDTSSR